MIVGIGIDLIGISRVRRTLDRFGERFLRRVYTEGERAYCFRKADPCPSLAARFAAKEAAMKALGTGVSRGVYFRNVEVTRAPGEPPRVVFYGKAKKRAESLGATGAVLSVTHDGDVAAAVVVLES